MIPVSVVIITKNEADFIVACLKAAKMITNDIVIVDNGSTDKTLQIAREYGCNVFENTWSGYGANKNKGIQLAKYNWILSLDADEVPDMELILSLYNLTFDDPVVVYDIKYNSYFGKKLIRHGRWGRDHHIRLFNRQLVQWTEPKVHEKLILPKNVRIQQLGGCLRHYSVKDENECHNKAIYYARLSAEGYFKAGKKASIINLYVSPVFGFLVDYILLLGMLDGKEGLEIARSIYKNKKFKYQYLRELVSSDNRYSFNRTLATDY